MRTWGGVVAFGILATTTSTQAAESTAPAAGASAPDPGNGGAVSVATVDATAVSATTIGDTTVGSATVGAATAGTTTPGAVDQGTAPAAQPNGPPKGAPGAVPPWQLRGVKPATSLRLDSTVGLGSLGGVSTRSSIVFVSGSYRAAEPFALTARIGVHDFAHGDDPTTAAVTNAAVGGLFGWALGSYFRVAVAANVVAPIGSGGGDSPNPSLALANKSAGLARCSYDGAMFAVNDVAFPVGLDAAFVYRRFTAQVETNVFTMARAKGETKNPDASKVSSTSGVFAGYFVLPELSLGSELRYQRWLSTPVAVEKDPSQRDSLTFGAGIRTHLSAGQAKIRPGVSYNTGIAGPVADNHYKMVSLDVPVVF